MSLHHIAHHVQSAGRGKDTVLVHMTPGEVKGLQAIAMAHGGSLTINPETGLPEAGFLSSILPMVAGFALNAFLPGVGTAIGSALGTSGAVGTSLLVGGATGLATGSLSKGLMAGLGAYGGAGLSEGLAAAGGNALGNGLGEFGATAGQGTGADYAKFLGDTGQTAVSNMPTAAANIGNVGGAGVNTLSGGMTGYTSPFANTGINAANYTAQFGPPPVDASKFIQSPDYAYDGISKAIGQGQINAANSPLGVGADVNAMAPQYAKAVSEVPKEMATYQTGTYTPPPSKLDKIGAGFKDVTSSGEKAWDFVKEHPGPFVTAGIGLASEMMGSNAGAGAGAAKKPAYLRPYEYSTAQDPNAYLANNSTAERRYFVEPRYTALPIQQVASGGLLGMAVGGPVEEMSAQNAVGDNMMYPQSQLHPAIYSNPMVQRPMPTDVISQGIDTNVNPFTGEIKMASGGSTDTKYAYDPATMQYTQSTTTTPATTSQNALLGNPIIGGMFGLAPLMVAGGMGHPTSIPGATFGQRANALFANPGQYLFGQQTQPTTTTQTSGGMTDPYAPQVQQAPITQGTTITPNINVPAYQTPEQQLGLEGFYDMMDAQLAKKGAQMQGLARGGMAGVSHLGGYSDGGRLLRGPGDGVSDSIPASIGNRQPARLADGEFVVPARIVSEIGNGSTEAGARKLYKMMDRVQNARRKTVGKGKVAVNSKSERFLPA